MYLVQLHMLYYDWEWAHLTGSRHSQQSGRMRGEFVL